MRPCVSLLWNEAIAFFRWITCICNNSQISYRIRPRHADTPHGPKAPEDRITVRNMYSMRPGSTQRTKREPESAGQSKCVPSEQTLETSKRIAREDCAQPAVAKSKPLSKTADKHENVCRNCRKGYVRWCLTISCLIFVQRKAFHVRFPRMSAQLAC